MQLHCMSSCTSSHIWCYVIVRRLALPHIHDATLVYVVLHFLTYMMQLHCMSSCTSSHIWCYVIVRRLALPHKYDATLLYIVLHFLTYMMQLHCMSSCTSSHTWCYAAVRLDCTSSHIWCNAAVRLFALPHMHDATRRYCMSSCTSSHIWCYASVRRLALPHIHDATPLYVVLHFLTYMMQCCCTAFCTSSHAWCYASVRRLALPHILDATLVYVVLHFLTYMMQLQCMSSCTSSHIWCYTAVRLFALPHIYGKTVPTKTSPSSLQKMWRTLGAEKKIVPLRCFTYPVKSTRVLFKEIELWERCKTTVICGMKLMTNTANVENAGSINNPPGCLTFTHMINTMISRTETWWFSFSLRSITRRYMR